MLADVAASSMLPMHRHTCVAQDIGRLCLPAAHTGWDSLILIDVAKPSLMSCFEETIDVHLNSESETTGVLSRNSTHHSKTGKFYIWQKQRPNRRKSKVFAHLTSAHAQMIQCEY